MRSTTSRATCAFPPTPCRPQKTRPQTAPQRTPRASAPSRALRALRTLSARSTPTEQDPRAPSRRPSGACSRMPRALGPRLRSRNQSRNLPRNRCPCRRGRLPSRRHPRSGRQHRRHRQPRADRALRCGAFPTDQAWGLWCTCCSRLRSPQPSPSAVGGSARASTAKSLPCSVPRWAGEEGRDRGGVEKRMALSSAASPRRGRPARGPARCSSEGRRPTRSGPVSPRR